MADIHDTETRRKNMRAVKHKNTKPELLLRRLLHANGFRYGLHNKNLPGKPDLHLAKYNAAVFVHGCFWHHHDCPKAKLPQTNTAFWRDKIMKNVARDEQNVNQLIERNKRVLIVWECALTGKHKTDAHTIITLCKAWLVSDSMMYEIEGNMIKEIDETNE